ncbi:hypothetical protein BO94DRAFT_622965 [Aspergillus sclerotioniger CBS 115572]|uniref:Nucleoside phosphorylase domain-containing protein n=1 Tax=Aspergillus sclerotioniger CBS 115572 TaxID=1450535 RepID=A0A317X3I5_9EURO|nr:hypothetical protein BO94DRAFT_622965 [Aspergillus sclerotioniger CBS 115572]PWY91538.1 hypothetical protein BO94DRAFT_622965 [Aspergillus sclerotioniger CBS 115572]
MAAQTPSAHHDYTVGWICALPIEMAAAQAVLDQVHGPLPVQPTDHNAYTLGAIGEHKIVIACLPSGAYGTTSATSVAMQLLSTFPSIRFGFMVGIGGAVPSKDADIRLGDIVVSNPTDTHGGVVQYDYGKSSSGGGFRRTGMLNHPPRILLTAFSKLRATHLLRGSQFMDFLADLHHKNPQLAVDFARSALQDHLYRADYDHEDLTSKACRECDATQTVSRPSRTLDTPVIHYGLIASGNQVVKNSRLRDKLGQELGVYCVEMEAAGLMNSFPCLVIRGIYDYADSHKNKEWQGYAAVNAASYAKALLAVVPASDRQMVRTLQEAAADGNFQVPFELTKVPAVSKFIGRTADLDRLWGLLQPDASNLRKVVVLHGMGGLAIFWINGQDENILIRSLADIAARLRDMSIQLTAIKDTKPEDTKQDAQQVLNWLSQEGNSKWLLIYDNVDQSPLHNSLNEQGGAYDIHKYIPSADHGSVIITTRLQKLAELGTSSYLLQRLPFIYRLDGLPLALALAGSYIHSSGMSYSSYMSHYNQAWCDLQAAAEAPREYSNGNMLTAWALSYHEVKKGFPLAAQFLYLPSFLHHDEIQFLRTIKVLVDFSLVQRQSGRGGYSLHPVIQEWCQYELPRIYTDLKETEDITWCIATAAIGYSVSNSSERSYWDLQHRLLPHASRVCQLVKYELGSSQYHQVLAAVHNLGRLYWNQGKHKEAEKLYQQVLAGRERVLGPDHIFTLDTVHNLGVVYHDQGNLREAEEMYQRVLAGYQKASGSSHIPNLHTGQLDTIQNLGSLYCTQKRLEEAEQMCLQALAGYERVLGPSHTSTLDAIHNLGNVYWSQQKLDEAEQLYLQALEGKENALGLNHTSTLDTVHNIGVAYYDQGKLQEAEEMYQQALSGKEKAFGLEHVSVLDTVFNLGRLYWTQSKLEQAEQMYQRAMTGCEKVLGPDHMSTLHTVHNLGVLYSARNMLQEAGKMHQRALTGYEKALGPDDISTLDFAHNLAVLYCKQGKSEKADAMLKRVLSGKKKVLGPSCPSVLAVINNLGNLYKQQERLDKAEEMYQYTLDGWLKMFGLEHPSTLGILNNLGILYQDQGRVKEAEEMYQEALAGYEKLAGVEDISTIDTVLNLGDVYRDQNRLRRARGMYERAHAGYEKTMGPDHELTREAADRVRLTVGPSKSRLREVIFGHFHRS